MINNISRLLEFKAYNNIATSVAGVQIHFTTKESITYVIVLSDLTRGDEFNKVQYENILHQIENQFRERGYLAVRLLSLICTDCVEKVKNLCEEGEICHWIVDQRDMCLVIYENQNTDFIGVKELLEGILVGKLHQVETESSNNPFEGQNRIKKSHIKKSLKNKVKNIRNEIRRRDLPVCTTILVFINVIIFLLIKVTSKHDVVLDWGASYYPDIMEKGQYYRLITHMFLHVDIGHLLGNMIVFFFIGERLEAIVGRMKYLFMYFGTGILAGIGSMSYNMIQQQEISSVGASGAIFGIVGAMAYVVVINRGRISDITPIRILLFIILSLYSGFSSPEVDNGAHIVGFCAGIVIALILYRRTPKRP